MALLTAKLPLPIKPKTWRGPSAARVRPTAWATSTANRLARDEREHARWRARAAHDGQWRSDEHGTRRRELVQIGELGESVFAGAEQERMAWERRIEAVRRAGVGTDRFHTEAD